MFNTRTSHYPKFDRPICSKKRTLKFAGKSTVDETKAELDCFLFPTLLILRIQAGLKRAASCNIWGWVKIQDLGDHRSVHFSIYMYLPSIFWGYPILTQSHLCLHSLAHLRSRSSKNASAEISLWSPSSSMQSWQDSNAWHNSVASANGRFREFQQRASKLLGSSEIAKLLTSSSEFTNCIWHMSCNMLQHAAVLSSFSAQKNSWVCFGNRGSDSFAVSCGMHLSLYTVPASLATFVGCPWPMLSRRHPIYPGPLPLEWQGPWQKWFSPCLNSWQLWWCTWTWKRSADRDLPTSSLHSPTSPQRALLWLQDLHGCWRRQTIPPAPGHHWRPKSDTLAAKSAVALCAAWQSRSQDWR